MSKSLLIAHYRYYAFANKKEGESIEPCSHRAGGIIFSVCLMIGF
ncbi:MAG: hypothetical protein QXL52_05640 [Nitrososphaerales archaeon]